MFQQLITLGTSKRLIIYSEVAYGIPPQEGYEALLRTPQEVVDDMIEESVNLPASVSRPNWLYIDDLPF